MSRWFGSGHSSDEPGLQDAVTVPTVDADGDERDAESLVPRGKARRQIRRWLWIFVVSLAALIATLLFFWDQEPVPIAGGVRGLTPILVLKGPGEGDLPSFTRPLSAGWGPGGSIYVSDTSNGRVCVFSSRGRFEREFGRVTTDTPKAQRRGQLLQPAGVAVSEDGTVYVADLRAGKVLVYNDRGRFLRSIRPSALPQKTFQWAPTDVAVSGDSVAVTDAEGVVLFTTEGKFVARLGEPSPGSRFVRPNGVTFANDGSLIISDTNQTRLVCLSPEGELFWTLNGESARDKTLGLPRGLSVADDGSVFVADAFRFALLRVSADGEYMDQYGARGDQPAYFQYPNDVDVRKDLAVVADKENDRVQVLRLEDLSQAELMP